MPRRSRPRKSSCRSQGSSVIIKRISIADMTDEELAESIKWEAEQYIPFSIDDVNVDFQKLGPGAAEGQADVLLVAVKKDKINDYVNLVKDAGLEPVVVDVDAFALANMCELNYEVEAGITALLNIGASVMNINILRDGVSIFTRDITVGGNRYTEALQRDAGLSYDDAEKIKRGEAVDGADRDQLNGIIVDGDRGHRGRDPAGLSTSFVLRPEATRFPGCSFPAAAPRSPSSPRSCLNGLRSRWTSSIHSRTSRSIQSILRRDS